MKNWTVLLWLSALPIFCQSNSGELRVHVADSAGRGIKVMVHILSEANQYNADLATDGQGNLEVARLPYGIYRLEIDQAAGFAPMAEAVAVRSSIPVTQAIALKLASVEQTVAVKAASTLIDPEQPGSVDQVGSSFIEHRLGSIPGRSLQDLVNSQPGWLYEGNAVLHPRGSEYQTQFVVDGIPLTDNRSPSFGPEIEADDVQSLSIYTAGIPAEYGRKMGGVVEVNTVQDSQPGIHGDLALAGGSFDTGSAFAKGQYTAGREHSGRQRERKHDRPLPESRGSAELTPIRLRSATSQPVSSAICRQTTGSASASATNCPATTFPTNRCNRPRGSDRRRMTSKPWGSPHTSTPFRRIRWRDWMAWCATMQMTSIQIQSRPQ